MPERFTAPGAGIVALAPSGYGFLGCARRAIFRACWSGTGWARRPGGCDGRRERTLRPKGPARSTTLVRALGLDGVSKGEVSRLCAELDERVERFRRRPLEEEYRYVLIDPQAHEGSVGRTHMRPPALSEFRLWEVDRKVEVGGCLRRVWLLLTHLDCIEDTSDSEPIFGISR